MINKRWLLWSSLLAFAAWLVWFGPGAPPAAAPAYAIAAAVESRHAPTSRTSQSSAQKPAAIATEAVIPRSRLFGRKEQKTRRDLFSVQSWSPPVVAAEVTTAPAPAAPSFNYLGKQYDGTNWEVYLSREDRTYIVKVGAIVDIYRVERIAPPELALVDLQSQQMHVLTIGEAP